MSVNNENADGTSTHSGSEIQMQVDGSLEHTVQKMRSTISRNIKRGSDVVSDALHMVDPWTVDESNQWKQTNYAASMAMVNEQLDPHKDMQALLQDENTAKIKIYDQWMKEVEDRENLTSKEQSSIFKKMREAHSFLFGNSSSEETVELENIPIAHSDTESGIELLETPFSQLNTNNGELGAGVSGIEGNAVLHSSVGEHPVEITDDDMRIFNLDEDTLWYKIIRRKKGWKDLFFEYMPICGWVSTYKKEYLQHDISVGLSSGTMIIPQAMAYAFLAGLPPIYGLYTAFIPTLIYAIFGSSRHLAVGPLALVSILVGATIRERNPATTDEYVAYANLLAFMVGINYTLMCLLKLGFLMNFLSRPVLSGFTSAAAVVIICSQLHFIFGVKVPNDTYAWQMIYHNAQQLPHAVWWETLLAVCCFVLLWVMKNKIKTIPKTRVPVPAPLILVVLGLILSYAARFDQRGIAVVGEIPSGLPKPHWITKLNWRNFIDMYADSLIIPIVGLIETVSAAKVAANKYKYELNMRQELFGLGMANLIGPFFSSYTAMGAFGRTALHLNSGSKTQLCSVISVFVVVMCLLLLTKVFYFLPKTILACIVMFAVSSLVDFEEIRRLYRINRIDMGLLIITFIATFAFGVQVGILLAVALSILLVLVQVSRPSAYSCGRLPGTQNYVDVTSYPDAVTQPGVVVFRFDSPLMFANANYFKTSLQAQYDKQEMPVYACIVDCASMTTIDSTGVKFLKEILREHYEKKILICFADVRPKVLEAFKRAKIYEDVGPDHFFMRVHDAIKSILQNTLAINPLSDDVEGLSFKIPSILGSRLAGKQIKIKLNLLDNIGDEKVSSVLGS